MARNSFHTSTGRSVTAVTAHEMRDVDRVAVEDVGLQLLQMMENAGRILAWHVRDVRESDVIVVAGNGGNGGGGLTCARHLANRDVPVRVVLDRPSEELSGAAAHQSHILDEMNASITSGVESLADADERTTIARVSSGSATAFSTPTGTTAARQDAASGHSTPNHGICPFPLKSRDWKTESPTTRPCAQTLQPRQTHRTVEFQHAFYLVLTVTLTPSSASRIPFLPTTCEFTRTR